MTSLEKSAAGEDDVDLAIREFHNITSRDYARFSECVGGGVVARRNVAERVRAPWRAGGPVMAATRETKTPSGIRLRIYTPQHAKPGRVLVYVHGGGWVMFSLDTHDRLMREYADRSGTTVVGVDYSLSPEAIYPRALDDVSSAFDWVADGGLGAGFEQPAIFLGGDSAGANLALATAMRARDEGRRLPDGLLLNYGAYDTVERPSHLRYDGDRYMLTRAEMAAFWRDYLGGQSAEACDYARPLRFDVARLPRTFMCIAECDILYDENRDMAALLRKAGVEVTEKVYVGATHSFLEAVGISSLAGKAFDDAAAWLKKTVED